MPSRLLLSFMDVLVMAAQPRLPSTYEDFCGQQGIELSTLHRLHDALGFIPPAGSDQVQEDDLVVVELFQQLLAVGADEDAALRLLRTYADALRRLTQAEHSGLLPTHIGIHAGPGEVLVSQPVADRIRQPSRLEPVGAVELKGVAQPLQVWRWAS